MSAATYIKSSLKFPQNHSKNLHSRHRRVIAEIVPKGRKSTLILSLIHQGRKSAQVGLLGNPQVVLFYDRTCDHLMLRVK
jgi:hypothetical protein